ncbi:MAG: hypothetical protein ACJAT7_003601 [Psychromonas sp.]|jgi:hypothetical protein|uniref:sulfotransferase family protein n=1 Tax=Psychromonas sp. TaxID=1884585 RepID=UPI0039E3F5E2
MSAAPIFIVGAPRSGTTLLTAFLAAHPSLDAGPETQFFNKIALVNKSKLDKAFIDTNWPRLATQLVCELTLAGQRVLDLFELSENKVFDFLAKKARTKKSMLESLTVLHALENNKSRWIEKTPNHILYVDEIRNLYPDAIIIRIVRDPRDSSVSIKQLPWASKSAIINSLLVNNWYLSSLEFFEKDEKSITIKYEELIAEPMVTLKYLCDFIGEDFCESMLNRSTSGKTISSVNEPWKKDVSKDLNPDRCYVWKRLEDQNVANCINSVCQTIIKVFDYDLKKVQKTPVYLVPVIGAFHESFDMYADFFVDNNLYLESNPLKSEKYLIWFEGQFRKDLKVIVQGIFLKLKGDKPFVVLPKQGGGLALLGKLLFGTL